MPVDDQNRVDSRLLDQERRDEGRADRGADRTDDIDECAGGRQLGRSRNDGDDRFEPGADDLTDRAGDEDHKKEVTAAGSEQKGGQKADGSQSGEADEQDLAFRSGIGQHAALEPEEQGRQK